MFARSSVSVDRPFAGRSTAAVLGLMVGVIASLAISVTAARAADEAQVAEQSSETVQSATATAEPTAEPAVEQESAPVADEPAEPAPAPEETEAPAPEVSPEPTEVEAPAEQPPVETPDPVQSEAPEPQPEPAEPAPAEPTPVQPPSNSATATNQSQTWQAIFQVQQGCQSHCQGTSQSQNAGQVAETIQSATAIGGGTGAPSSATALNQSTTGQFIWQVQLGCVAFCYGTSQSQTAAQSAQTTQTATALSEGSAQAGNVGSVMQEVWQLQYGCQVECYGNSQTQSSTQGSSTNQSATATSETWAQSYPTDAQSLIPAWLVALAENLGITIQTSWQYQEASCVEWCVGDSQSQDATQNASTTQDARAVAGVPPEEPTLPVLPAPPAEEPAPAPAVASTARATSAESLLERTSATWRRAWGEDRSAAQIRRRSSVTTSSGPSRGASIHTSVESSTHVEAGSSESKASTSVTTNSTSSSASASSSTDSSAAKIEPLRGLDKADSGYGLISWLLIGLLMAVGVATLRKAYPPQTVA